MDENDAICMDCECDPRQKNIKIKCVTPEQVFGASS